MVDIVDDTRSFTVAVMEGFATIENLSYPSEAMEGDPVPVSFNLRNAGGTDTLYAKVGQAVELFRGSVDSAASVPISFQIGPMPPYNLVATLEVGHEEESDVMDTTATIEVYPPGEAPKLNMKLIAGLLGMGVVGLVMIKAT